MSEAPMTCRYRYHDGKTHCAEDPADPDGLCVWHAPHVVKPEGKVLRGVLEEMAGSGISLEGFQLSTTDLSGIGLKGARIPEANVSQADLSKADFSETYAWALVGRQANLSRARFGRANLMEADLAGADLNETDLRGADLSRADLSGGLLCGATIDAADISGADFSGADLASASFHDVRFDSETSFRNSRNLKLAKGLPDELLEQISQGQSPESLHIQGNLRLTGLTSILNALAEQKATGALVFKREEVEKTFLFRRGAVIFATSTHPDDRLGEVLVREGKITARQYEDSVNVLKLTGRRQGKILVEMDALSPKELFWAVKHQVKEIIYSVFSWDRGFYEFNPEPLPSESITLSIPLEELIMEGIRRLQSWRRVRQGLESLERSVSLSANYEALAQNLNLSLEEWDVLALIDGQRTIRSICEASPLSDFRVSRCLYGFALVGVTELGPEPSS